MERETRRTAIASGAYRESDHAVKQMIKRAIDRAGVEETLAAL